MDVKINAEQQQEVQAKSSAAVVEPSDSIGLPLESKLPTSSQSLTGSVSPLENAMTSSLELLGSPSSDISQISKEKRACFPAQHEDDSSVINGNFANSTARIGADAALPPKEYHGVSAGDASKGMDANIFCQFEGRNLPGFADNQTNEKIIANEINKEEDMPPVILNGHHLHTHVQVPMHMKGSESAASTEHVKKLSENKRLVHIAAPFESVREAVSKFGGIVDWKAHKTLTVEKRKHIHGELEKIQGVPIYEKDSEAAEVAKDEALKELDSINSLVELLKLNLERAQINKVQAKQNAQLAQLQAKEIKDGIADAASIASVSKLEVAEAWYEAAVAELNSELIELQEQSTFLVGQSEIVMRRSEEAISASKEIEKEVEGLTRDLITAKESLESAHAAHLEAEEHRLSAALARDKDCLYWDKELQKAQEGLHMLNEQFLQVKDVKTKLIGASSLLAELKKELAAYMESQLKEQSASLEEDESEDDLDLASKKKELDKVKTNVEMARNEVSILRVAESSLKSKLESEKAELVSLRQREEMGLIAVSSLEAEIERTIEEIEQVVAKEKIAREKVVELPKLLQRAALEAEKSKSSTKMAREEQRRLIEEVEQVRSTLSISKFRLTATLKEIEASAASERLALAAVKALEDSEAAAAMGESSLGVPLPLEEYYTLSKKAHEAEESANERIIAVAAEIEAAKVSELNSLQRLKYAYQELDRRKEELRDAAEKANKAKEGKLWAEQGLRKWRAEHEQQRRASRGGQSALNPPMSPAKKTDDSFVTKTESTAAVSVAANVIHLSPGPKVHISGDKIEHAVPDFKPRKKSFIPHMVMFIARKKAQSRK
ncbi:protein WEAK CHLOROPLAST MOVEMENT UNDER BLUE LIGHT 1-like isoform X2 [Phalaenopsis equestris]|uniref:protein WEAK CHLOROPLAST MOVEMENT UNDER BLUE LIGHT 1-like isoform X2 n=1 Tax=Phalaenopsis equestris TaxID=78828 RepID=UPI0009E25E36|nr:protein WEAK CHLOROPLAST MOVEMENT UNDER BLUE LIGHT 1-like isoform X2 [Phalaenopsis equestris]